MGRGSLTLELQENTSEAKFFFILAQRVTFLLRCGTSLRTACCICTSTR